MDRRDLIACVDLTALGEDQRADALDELCDLAIDPGPGLPPVAAVCVWPRFVPSARARLALSPSAGVRVATVVSFPTGIASPAERAREVKEALAAGADEIDMVLAPDALENPTRAMGELVAARHAAGAHTLKVIIETGRLAAPDRIRAATRLVMDAGADFVKSSTGRGFPGVTADAARAMCSEIAEHRPEDAGRERRLVGLKFSGGIRDIVFASELADIVEEILGTAWLTPEYLRIGASRLPTGTATSSQ